MKAEFSLYTGASVTEQHHGGQNIMEDIQTLGHTEPGSNPDCIIEQVTQPPLDIVSISPGVYKIVKIAGVL